MKFFILILLSLAHLSAFAIEISDGAVAVRNSVLGSVEVMDREDWSGHRVIAYSNFDKAGVLLLAELPVSASSIELYERLHNQEQQNKESRADAFCKLMGHHRAGHYTKDNGEFDQTDAEIQDGTDLIVLNATSENKIEVSSQRAVSKKNSNSLAGELLDKVLGSDVEHLPARIGSRFFVRINCY